MIFQEFHTRLQVALAQFNKKFSAENKYHQSSPCILLMFKQNVACTTILSTTNIAGTLSCNQCLFCKQYQIFIYCIIYKTSKKDSPVTYMIVCAHSYNKNNSFRESITQSNHSEKASLNHITHSKDLCSIFSLGLSILHLCIFP